MFRSSFLATGMLMAAGVIFSGVSVVEAQSGGGHSSSVGRGGAIPPASRSQPRNQAPRQVAQAQKKTPQARNKTTQAQKKTPQAQNKADRRKQAGRRTIEGPQNRPGIWFDPVQPDPWFGYPGQIGIGQPVAGTVVRIVNPAALGTDLSYLADGQSINLASGSEQDVESGVIVEFDRRAGQGSGLYILDSGTYAFAQSADGSLDLVPFHDGSL
jgi:hypothetical protein